MRHVAVFLTAALADVAWASWTMHAAERRAAAAATWGVLIFLFGSVAVRAYVDDPIYLLPAAAGAWVGTYFTVRRKNPARRDTLGA